jgi:2,3-bisphosphoglycerate-independent phosphoglycerate mutase
MYSEINIAASKHVTKLKGNDVQCLETRPWDHTFTSGHTLNKYNIIEPIDSIINMQLKTILQWKTNTNQA